MSSQIFPQNPFLTNETERREDQATSGAQGIVKQPCYRPYIRRRRVDQDGTQAIRDWMDFLNYLNLNFGINVKVNRSDFL